ncbi:MAG: hypothetical protein HY286_15695 [Planctomycetes bacterium]|nr:hypothetical protein [Planctomycetota bacterium]
MNFRFSPPGNIPDYDIENAIGCDGRPPAALSLSHWPDNDTPSEFRHDFSTGSALLFARRAARDSDGEFARFVTVANDHFDTDGLLSVFACLQPKDALAREEFLLFAAEAGDLWRAPTGRAAAFDMAVSASTEPGRSKIASSIGDVHSREGMTAIYQYFLERLPGALDDPFSLDIDIRDEYNHCMEDLASLRSGNIMIERAPECDFAIINLPRAHDARAIFEIARTDRVLELQHCADGTLAQLRFTSMSWFDGMSQRRLPRPNLIKLADRLQQNERGAGAWQSLDPGAPFAALAFGARRKSGIRDDHFDLAPSSQPPESIKKTISQFLRESRP